MWLLDEPWKTGKIWTYGISGNERTKEEEGPDGRTSRKILYRKGLGVFKESGSVSQVKLLKLISYLGHSVTHPQMEKSFPVELAKYLEKIMQKLWRHFPEDHSISCLDSEAGFDISKVKKLKIKAVTNSNFPSNCFSIIWGWAGLWDSPCNQFLQGIPTWLMNSRSWPRACAIG